jgi:protein O-GlcNAc transferase
MNPQIDLLLNQAIQSFQSGDLAKAQSLLGRILLVQPKNLPALHVLGLIKASLSKHAEAAELLKKAVRINPQDASLQYNLAKALFESGNIKESLAHHKKAVELSPGNQEAWLNYGKCLSSLGEHQIALSVYEKSLTIRPDFAEALINKGATLKELGLFEEALNCANQALEINPQSAEAWSNKGAALKDLNRSDEALICYENAVTLNPTSEDAWFNKGIAFSKLKRHEDAITCFNAAISLKPSHYEALYSKGIALSEMKNFAEGIDAFNEAINLKPDFDYLLGNLIQAKFMIGDWSNLDSLINTLTNQIKLDKKVISPFGLFAASDSPSLHLQAAKIWANDKNPIQAHSPFHEIGADKKIRIGYFSADFTDHPVAHLTAEIYELHDRSCFEVFAFSLSPAKPGDEMRERLIKGFDHFFNVEDMSDSEVAKLARDNKIDIAIDLGGYTQGSRAGIFSYGAAPLQVNYLGHPGTMASKCFDYIIADPTIIPENSQQYYTESIAYLPHSYMADDSKRQASSRVITRKEFGLPDDRFIFCSFNNSYKFNPSIVSTWAKILVQVEGSVLWVTENNQSFKQNLLDEFSKYSISNDRIIFAGRVHLMEDHLARYRLADLFLNTHPYNAHTTALDALKAGLPVLTILGESFAARVGASLLKSTGLPELITSSEDEYIALAVEIGHDPNKLQALRTKLAGNIPTSPLFNTALFTKHLETIYQEMVKQKQAGKEPANIYL